MHVLFRIEKAHLPWFNASVVKVKLNIGCQKSEKV